MRRRFTMLALAGLTAMLGACQCSSITGNGARSPLDGPPPRPADAPVPSDPTAPEGSGPATGTALQALRFNNRSQRVVVGIAVSPVSQGLWGSNLASQPLRPGESGAVSFQRATIDCEFDIRVTDESGATQDLTGIDLCRAPDVDFAG